MDEYGIERRSSPSPGPVLQPALYYLSVQRVAVRYHLGDVRRPRYSPASEYAGTTVQHCCQSGEVWLGGPIPRLRIAVWDNDVIAGCSLGLCPTSPTGQMPLLGSLQNLRPVEPDGTSNFGTSDSDTSARLTALPLKEFASP